MKKKTLFLGLIVGVSAIGMALTTNDSAVADELSNQNIEALAQGSGSSRCDARNKNECEIYGVGRGTGALENYTPGQAGSN